MACRAARDKTGWFSTMPAEWQLRQLLLMASAAPPPGKLRSLVGRSRLTDCSVTPAAVATEGAGAGAAWLVSAAGAGTAAAVC
jgi:hypothetical protein